MNYILLKESIIANIIVAEPDIATQLGGFPSYPGAAIGDRYDPPHAYTELELTQIEITDLCLSDIEQGQAITELELTILGGK